MIYTSDESLAEGKLSVIIPTLDAADSLPSTLSSLAGLPIAEVIVVDGGSSDASCALARAYGAQVIGSPRGRGQQLSTGAEASRAPWLLFLHADTCLDNTAATAVRSFTAGRDARQDDNHDVAGYFRFRFDQSSRNRMGMVVERWVELRSRIFGLPFGDQGLLIHRSLYRKVGGYPLWPLMEDVGLVERLGRKRLRTLEACAVTCGMRYRRDGYLARGSRNLLCFTLYRCGVSPARLLRLYSGRASRD